MEPWVWAIVVTVALAILGALWALFRKTTDRTEERLDKHIEEDTRVHERVSVLESKTERMEKQIDGQGGIIDRLHKHGNDITRALGKLFVNERGK